MPSYKKIDREITERVERINKKRDYIISKIYNSELEKKTRDRPEEEMLEIFEQDIKEQLIYIFGEEWKAGIYDLELSCQYAFEDGYDLALNVWLSKQGYITWKSFHASGYNRPDDNRDNERIITRAIQTIEANMQAKHPDLRLELVSEAYPNDPVLHVRWNFNDLDWRGEYITVPGLEPADSNPLHVFSTDGNRIYMKKDPLSIVLIIIAIFGWLWFLLSKIN